MSTFILKTHTSKSRNETIFKIEPYREKVPLLLFEENVQRMRNEEQIKSHQLHLPNIYQTENLLTAKFIPKYGKGDFDKENDFSMPKLFKRNVDHHKRKVQNNLKRLATDEKDKDDLQHVYHNFISKKKNKKKVHMSKIIDKVISEDIEPWVL
jgi:hypothetical protein